MPRYVAGYKLEFGQIGGDTWTAAPDELVEDITQIVVEESLHLPTMFTIIVSNPYFPAQLGDRPWQHENLFQFGKGIRIGFSPSTSEDPQFQEEIFSYVVEGEITAIESHFNSESQAPLIIRGYDISHRLHRGRHNRSFQNMKDVDIVHKLLLETGILPGEIEDNTGPYGYNDISGMNGYVFQNNQTNMEFLQDRAARKGVELFVDGSRLQFCKPKAKEPVPLTWMENLLSFRVRVNSTEQVKKVEVRGWDYGQKQVIQAIRETEEPLTQNDHGKGSQSSSTFGGKPVSPTVTIVDQPIFAPQEAETIAQALLDELGEEFIQADARANGNPLIRPRCMVKLKDMNKYSGNYYVTETRHIYQSGYYTEFSIRGMRSSDLMSTLVPPQKRLMPGQTLLAGIVTENKDPKGWGRVRVKFPTLSEDHNSYWARMVQIGAGENRGFDCLPEINDEVLVAFEHGDIHRPYILGGVWNGRDKPPVPVGETIGHDGTVRLRTFKTRTGHQLQFVEEDKSATSKAGTYLETSAGHQLKMNDTDRTLILNTPNRHTMTLDDQKQQIELKTPKGQHLNLKDGDRTVRLQGMGSIDITAPNRITLSVGTNRIELSTNGITIQSGSTVTIQAPTINLEGTSNANISGSTVSVQGSLIRIG
jgi:uncharacterized protein involved in type VI secretion and phage assembly